MTFSTYRPISSAVPILLAIALVSGCGGSDDAARRARSASPSAARPVTRATARATVATTAFAPLERRYGARLGVYVLDTGTGRTIVHRADERFAFCSTFKALAA